MLTAIGDRILNRHTSNETIRSERRKSARAMVGDHLATQRRWHRDAGRW